MARNPLDIEEFDPLTILPSDNQMIVSLKMSMHGHAQEAPEGAAELASWWGRLGAMWGKWAVHFQEGHGNACHAYNKAAGYYRELGNEAVAQEYEDLARRAAERMG